MSIENISNSTIITKSILISKILGPYCIKKAIKKHFSKVLDINSLITEEEHNCQGIPGIPEHIICYKINIKNNDNYLSIRTISREYIDFKKNNPNSDRIIEGSVEFESLSNPFLSYGELKKAIRNAIVQCELQTDYRNNTEIANNYIMEPKSGRKEIGVEAQEARIEAQEALIEALEARIEAQEAQIEAQKTRIEEREARVEAQEALAKQLKAKVEEREALLIAQASLRPQVEKRKAREALLEKQEVQAAHEARELRVAQIEQAALEAREAREAGIVPKKSNKYKNTTVISKDSMLISYIVRAVQNHFSNMLDIETLVLTDFRIGYCFQYKINLKNYDNIPNNYLIFSTQSEYDIHHGHTFNQTINGSVNSGYGENLFNTYGDFKKAIRNAILQFQLKHEYMNNSKVKRNYKMSHNNYRKL